MVKNIFRGKRYKVLSDSDNNFRQDDIVIALESGCDCSLCILEKHFTNVENCFSNPIILDKYVWLLCDSELEEIEGEKYEESDILKAGKKYRVIHDDANKFKDGDIVVSLEESTAPYCILEEHFTNIYDCLHNDEIFYKYVDALCYYELEEINS